MKVTGICYGLVFLSMVVTVTNINLGIPISQCTDFVMDNKLKKDLPPLLMQRKLNRSMVICVKKSKESLIRQLKDVGGYNPDYIATDERELKYFVDPAEFSKTGSRRPTRRRPITPKPTKTPTIPLFLRYFRLVSTSNAVKRSNDFKRFKRSNHVNRFKRSDHFGLKECTNAGDDVEPPTHRPQVHMCHSCHYVKEQYQNHFPPYLNERVCTNILKVVDNVEIPENYTEEVGQEGMCWHKSGMCVQVRTKLKGLVLNNIARRKKIGDQYVGILEFRTDYTLEIRSSCECQCFKDRGFYLNLPNTIP